jgi:hypothetical protein
MSSAASKSKYLPVIFGLRVFSRAADRLIFGDGNGQLVPI